MQVNHAYLTPSQRQMDRHLHRESQSTCASNRAIALLAYNVFELTAYLPQAYITSLPREVLATPFGQMIAPGLGNMQGRLNSTQVAGRAPPPQTPFQPPPGDVTKSVTDSLRSGNTSAVLFGVRLLHHFVALTIMYQCFSTTR